MTASGLLSLLIAIGILVPILIVLLECLAALLPGRANSFPGSAPRPKCVVLIPAHDEEPVIRATIESIRCDLAPADRVLVVAHNCADRTASLGRSSGAEVVEVKDDGGGGKADAIAAGVLALAADPPKVVVIVDADCKVHPGAIDALTRAAAHFGAPVQGSYLLETEARQKAIGSVSSLAILLKNFIRPMGLHRLGFPGLLHGSGSAHPYLLLKEAPHGKASIVEDYQLSIDMALMGYPVRFCPEARITSTLPSDRRIARRQRKRWEHGHLHIIFHAVPGLFLAALRRGRPGLFALALNLSVPPLALLLCFWLAACLTTGAMALRSGETLPVVLLLSGGAGLFLAIAGNWVRYAGFRETAAALLGVPLYVAWKTPLYLAYLWSREKRWTKTPRGPSTS
jgi:cellulose synthase/poly-beta-1,6-N-acetylglucosamine synthase-like glycosyltransferase